MANSHSPTRSSGSLETNDDLVLSSSEGAKPTRKARPGIASKVSDETSIQREEDDVPSLPIASIETQPKDCKRASLDKESMQPLPYEISGEGSGYEPISSGGEHCAGIETIQHVDNHRMDDSTGTSHSRRLQAFKRSQQQNSTTAHALGDLFVVDHHGYNNVYHDDRSEHSLRQTFHFSMKTCAGDPQGGSLVATISRLRSQHVLRKQSSMPPLLNHVDKYKPYAKVKCPKVLNALVRVARQCLRLDRMFAALFTHILEAKSYDEINSCLKSIRREIAEKQTKNPLPGSRHKEVYLGDLGHFCEVSLEHYSTKDKSSEKEFAARTPGFGVTRGDNESLLHYLQDSFEVLYWKMMLEFFGAFRANESSMGGDVVCLALDSMRSEIRKAHRQLKATMKASTRGENIGDLIRGIETRVEILSSFTDLLVADTDEEEEEEEEEEGEANQMPRSQPVRRQTTGIRDDQDSATAPEQDQGKPSTIPEAQGSSQQKLATPNSSYLNSILTTISLMATIAGIIPFLQGYRISRSSPELGTKQDADYWFTMSSGLTVIFSNFAMVLPLWKSSWTIKTHLITAFWIVTGVACAITSMAIYEGYNTAWSSLLAFFATVAGFAATLSIAMTEEGAGGEKEKGRDGESKKDR